MTRDSSIVELGDWLKTPPGSCVLAWEQERLDRAVADAFGYYALQLGLPQLEALRANRMPHRWVLSDSLVLPEQLPNPVPPLPDDLTSTLPPPEPVALIAEFDALPFASASIDLVVLPHALELARDPHQTLREVERVLVPEGRVVITGFNPASLWGLRQHAGRATQRVGAGRGQPLYLPSGGDFIGYRRLRDWLRLLGFEVEAGRFGCWRPPVTTQAWLDRYAWLDKVGDRWWPVLGATYCVEAVKRVRGMHLIGRAKTERRKPSTAPAVVANRQSNRQTNRQTSRQSKQLVESGQDLP
jgi:SAM-dependent methyltransferase